MDKIFSKPPFAFLGCTTFVALGVYLWGYHPSPVAKAVGIASILFFGLGAVKISLDMVKQALTKTRTIYASKPEDVSVAKEDVDDDDEVLEAWERTGEIDSTFQRISAMRMIATEFAWGVMVSAGEFVTEDGAASRLDESICRALHDVPGVREVVREDREYWVVDGDCDGGDLVRAAAIANDSFLKHHHHHES